MSKVANAAEVSPSNVPPAWHVAEAMRACGLDWCNGLIGLYAAGYFWDLVQMIPHLEVGMPLHLSATAADLFDQLHVHSRSFDHFPEEETASAYEPYLNAWLELPTVLGGVPDYEVLNWCVQRLDHSRVPHPHVGPVHPLASPLYFMCDYETDFYEAEYFFHMIYGDILESLADGRMRREHFVGIEQYVQEEKLNSTPPDSDRLDQVIPLPLNGLFALALPALPVRQGIQNRLDANGLLG